MNIGTVNGNVIGASSGNSSISIYYYGNVATSSPTGIPSGDNSSGTNIINFNATNFGINVSGTGTVDIENNSIGSVTTDMVAAAPLAPMGTTAAATGANNFHAIYKANVAGTTTISNNFIGSSATTGSIRADRKSTRLNSSH